MLRWTFAVCSLLALGACFTGGFLMGQPCQSDGDCGPSLACEGGYCGGTGGGTGTTAAGTTTSGTTGQPTTSGTGTSTAGPGTSTGDDTTSGSTSGSTSGATSDGTTGPTCGLGRCTDLDLVVIVDNSASMADKNNTLLAALVAFEKFVRDDLTQACSVHMGVTTTDLSYEYNPFECKLSGALVQADYEYNPCETVDGHPYATLADLANLSSLLCLIRVGSEGDIAEKPIESMLYLFDADINKADGCNEGFLRKDSQMVIIMATDEDDDANDAQGNDGSNIPLALWHDSLVALKPESELLMVGLLGDPDPNTTMCPWDPLFGSDGLGAESSPALRSFFESFPEERRVIGSVCQDEGQPGIYDALMQELRDKLRLMCEV